MTSTCTRAALVACSLAALAPGAARAADPVPSVAVRCGRLIDGRQSTKASIRSDVQINTWPHTPAVSIGRRREIPHRDPQSVPPVGQSGPSG